MKFREFTPLICGALGMMALFSFQSTATDRNAIRVPETALWAAAMNPSAIEGSYLGQTPPGVIPEIFAPGIISTRYSERSVVFSPMQDELFFEMRGLGFTSVILRMTQRNGLWSPSEMAFFSGIPEYTDASPFYSYDGRHLFFVSCRPVSGDGLIREDSDIWMATKSGDTWGQPISAGSPLNSALIDDYPSLSKSNNLYFCSNRDGNFDIYVSHLSGTGFSEPRRLGPGINTKDYEGHPFIAADESYLIFSSDRPGELGQADLYISFKGKDGKWREPINMGVGVNSASHEAAPYVSPDGRYLFFCSFRTMPRPSERIRLTYGEIRELLDGPGNGSGDIYWVSTKIIESMRAN